MNNADAEEPAEQPGELKDTDYISAGEGGDEDENKEDGEQSMEQQETDSFVRYFSKDDAGEKGNRIGCAFENLCVRGEGRAYYALVDPTPRAGNEIVSAAAVLVPCDPDSHGVADIFELTRTYVLEMKRSPNFQFIYAVVMCIDNTDSDGVVETST